MLLGKEDLNVVSAVVIFFSPFSMLPVFKFISASERRLGRTQRKPSEAEVHADHPDDLISIPTQGRVYLLKQ